MKFPGLFFLSLLLINSCSQGLNNIPDTGRKIVINGLITTDSLINVQIGRSSYINSYNISNDLEKADVKLYLNETYLDSLSRVPFYTFYVWNVFNPGNYRSKSITPQSGMDYKIVVKAADLPVASAKTIIPDMVKIIKVDTTGIVLPAGLYISSNKGIICKIEFIDPPGERNYYLFNIREIVKEHSSTPNNNLGFSCTDPIVEEQLFSGEKIQGIAFSDKIINGKKYILTIILNKEVIGMNTSGDIQAVSFRLYSITEEYFHYIRNLNLYSKNFGNPLTEPVLLFSNIVGGYGMFTGAAVSSYLISFNI